MGTRNEIRKEPGRTIYLSHFVGRHRRLPTAAEERRGCEPGPVPNFVARGGAGPAFRPSVCSAWRRRLRRRGGDTQAHDDGTLGHARTHAQRLSSPGDSTFPHRLSQVAHSCTHARTNAHERHVVVVFTGREFPLLTLLALIIINLLAQYTYVRYYNAFCPLKWQSSLFR